MWWKKNFLPIAPEARRRWRHHVFDSAFVVLGQGGMTAALIAIGRSLDPAKPLWLILVLGLLLPFLVWNWLIGIVIYAHHTHPAIPWFDDRTKWKAARAELYGTAHVRLPQPIHLLSNNIMEHNAHHMDPGIPFYHLATKQEQLRRLTGGILFFKLGLGSYLRIVRYCKLFDFERGCWTQFDERPTAGRIA
jgi:omega-6 fatty acid desaturase (delta-12 desaturase)